MGTFNNTPVNGIWKLRVMDNAIGDTGRVIQWGLRFNNQIGIKQISSILPDKFSLYQNFPNPFNPSTTIKYAIPKDCNVTIKIYDLLGRELNCLVNENQKAGYYSVKFNGSNLASGIYFYRIQAGSFVQTKKMVLIK